MPYVPHTAEEREQMLAAMGQRSLDELFADIPASVRAGLPHRLALRPALREDQLLRLARGLADANQDLDHLCCLRGAGAYDRFIPVAVPALVNQPGFLTAYTPYQAEVSQGALQAMWEYQSLICNLTDLEVSNASLYDGASALAEAVGLAAVATGRNAVWLSAAVHPEYGQVVKTYTAARGIQVLEMPAPQGVTEAAQLPTAARTDRATGLPAALVVQNPNFFGLLEGEIRPLVQWAHDHGALFIEVVDPVSLAILATPGELGADLAVGSGQGLGQPLAFGGPYFGFLAARAELLRRLPGRIVGETTDGQGRRGFVLVLQSREQHIRREKASSNICTNHALGALAAAVYLSLLGPAGLNEVATTSWRNAHYLAARLQGLPGVEWPFPAAPFFQEFTFLLPGRDPEAIDAALLAKGFLGPLPLGRLLPDPRWRDAYLACATEMRTRDELDRFVAALGEVLA